MGLSVSLSNALSGMHTTQKGLEVLSRNVANAGTPGYHRQSVNIAEEMGNGSSAYARLASVDRAFTESLQRLYNQELSNIGNANVKADFLSRIETQLGKPGDDTSLNSLYQNFENAMQAMVTSPDDYTARSEVVSSAQLLASKLNSLTASVQGLRQEAENQISTHVTELNRSLQSLAKINNSLSDQTGDATSRAALLDERDRLVASISELIDTNVVYRPDDTVAIMTSTGLGLLDNGATVFEFQGVGGINAGSLSNIDDTKNGVGNLYATTPSGLRLDLVEQGIIQSGRLGGLLDLRDDLLVEMQGQLDEIASGLAQSLSTVTTEGTAIAGPPDGFSLDLANVQKGNDFTVSYTVNGTAQTVRVVRVDDPSKLPMDTTGPNGERVLGLDFSGGIGAVATALDAALGPAINVSSPGGTTLEIVDDGLGNTSDITGLSSRTTATGNQNGTLAISLFTDANNAGFTNSLDGNTQKLGFAGRININTAIVNDNSLLVKYDSGTSLGDPARAQHLLDGLQKSTFTATNATAADRGNFRLAGGVQNMISQMMNYQGNSITSANSNENAAALALEAVTIRTDAEYGVNVDEEMARLLELQNSYAASARIVSVVQELIDNLMNI